MENAQWKSYGSLLGIYDWEASVNTLTVALAIREYVNHLETVEEFSMENNPPQKVVMNVLWNNFITK